MSEHPKELIVVRKLAESDLGLFAVQRNRVRSKQRALNINAAIAERILSPRLFAAGGGQIECTCVYQGRIIRESRSLQKTHKNWRLGGKKIDGEEFAKLQPGDFAVIRCTEGNDGSYPMALSFVSKVGESVEHGGLAEIVEKNLEDGMAAFDSGSKDFNDFMHLCPRELIVIRSLAESDLGLFAAHRSAIASKQRAFNINARIAQQMLSLSIFETGGTEFDCPCVFKSKFSQVKRPLTKVTKNWRLGGPKFEGTEFKELGCKDFLLMRSVEWNDGRYPITLSFVTKKNQRVAHAGLAQKTGTQLRHSMIAVAAGSPLCEQIAQFCPNISARSGRNGKRISGRRR